MRFRNVQATELTGNILFCYVISIFSRTGMSVEECPAHRRQFG